jgi:hypothetical protein
MNPCHGCANAPIVWGDATPGGNFVFRPRVVPNGLTLGLLQELHSLGSGTNLTVPGPQLTGPLNSGYGGYINWMRAHPNLQRAGAYMVENPNRVIGQVANVFYLKTCAEEVSDKGCNGWAMDTALRRATGLKPCTREEYEEKPEIWQGILWGFAGVWDDICGRPSRGPVPPKNWP